MTKVWDINSQEYKDEIARIEEEGKFDKLYQKLDDILAKYNRNNFRYSKADTYLEYKTRYEEERDAILKEIEELKNASN